MLIRILAFLLETIFFVLIAAALLRAWMTWVRIPMNLQPGSFVTALTDWLVNPVRRVLPKSLTQSQVDWASVIAAVVLALAYALLWSLLFGVLLGVAHWSLQLGPVALLSLLVFALKMLIRVALQTLIIMVLGYAILSWIQPGSPVYALLGHLTDPVLAPLRRVIPRIGGVDISAIVLIVLLQIALMILV